MAFAALKKNIFVKLAVMPLVEKRRLKNYMRRAELRDVPEILQVEPTAACNLKCVMCFRGKGDFDVRPMDFSLFTSAGVYIGMSCDRARSATERKYKFSPLSS